MKFVVVIASWFFGSVGVVTEVIDIARKHVAALAAERVNALLDASISSRLKGVQTIAIGKRHIGIG